MRLSGLFLAMLLACGGAPAKPATLTPAAPRDLALDGDANGLLWADGVLYVADSAHDRLLRWDGHDAFVTVATLPSSGRPGLGQPARLPGGGFLVPRFGHGQTGGLIVVDGKGAATLRAGLDPARKRVGVAVAGDGKVYEVYFGGHGDGGALAVVGDDGAEKDLVPGLGKPLGLLIRGDVLTYSDQARGELRRCQLPACASPETVAAVPGADLFAMDRAGVFYVGTKDGAVVRAGAGGKVEPLLEGLGRVRGVAVDDDGGRLFVAARLGERAFVRVMPLKL